jgi:hypothetical protein
MATPEQILAQVDQRAGAQFHKLVTAQTNYHAARGKFAQGLPTHTTPPTDGVDSPPDRLSHRPTDQAESWDDLSQQYALAFPSPNIAALSIDPYHGPRGQGWVARLQVVITGQLWEKCINVGPETERNQPWKVIP